VQEIAHTVEVLPVHGALPPNGSRSQILGDIIAALRNAGTPDAYGFMNAKGIADEGPDAEQAVQLWRNAHLPLGNHTLSHFDLHGHTAPEFEREIAANEPALQRFMQQESWHQFRYPYLHEGEILDQRNAVRDYLYQNGYSIAQVTLDAQDYLYNDTYVRCLAKNDASAVQGLKQTYLDRAAESLALAKAVSQKLWGRDIRHVMLMHVGTFEAATLPDMLKLFSQHRVKLITLEQAQMDPAYAIDPRVSGQSVGTFLNQMLLSKQLPLISRNDDALRKIGELCK
jgi:hypothetical protein